MTSVMTKSFKQSQNGYFIPLGNVALCVQQYTPGSGAGGSAVAGSFALATWAQGGSTPHKATSTISTVAAGGLLRDMGKTVLSSGRTFRKIQLMTSAVSTGGVGGPAGVTTTVNVDYLTGYIELASGFNSLNGVAGVAAAGSGMAPVAYYPGLF
jgi:hypothetical protein